MSDTGPLYPPTAKDIARHQHIAEFMKTHHHNYRNDIYLLNVECELILMLMAWEKKLEELKNERTNSRTC